MKKWLFVLPLVAALSGCASQEAVTERNTLKKAIAELETRLAGYQDKNGADSAFLRQQIESARGRLEEVNAQIRQEKVASVAQPAAQVMEGAAPYANALFPGAGALLVAAAGFVGGLGKKKTGAA